MVRLQTTAKAEYFIVLPSEMIRIAGWKEGEEIVVRFGRDISPKSRDLVLRRK